MSKFRYRSCYLSELADVAGVDVRTFRKWFSQEDVDRMVSLGFRSGQRKLGPKVVEFVIENYLPDMMVDEFKR